MAYDPANARLFVADFGDSSITVIDTVTDQVIAGIPLSYGISDPVYDSSDGLVYVGTCCSSIYAIDANSSEVVASIPLGAGCSPGCALGPSTYDSYDQNVYLEDGFTNNLTVIHGQSISFIANVGPDPYGLGYDSRNGNVYVSNEGNSSLTIINGSRNQITGWIPGVQPGPAVVADAANGEIFVGGNNVSGQANVTIVNGTTNRIAGTVLSRNASGGAAYDPVTGDVYVSQRFNFDYTPSDVWNVSVVDGTTNRLVGTLPTQWGPIGVAYSDFNHEVYVANSNNNTVTALLPLRSIDFHETGLPAGTPWSVTVNDIPTRSSTANVAFSGADGPYQYAVPSIRNYTVSTSSGSFELAGSNRTVAISFAPLVTTPSYSIQFNETGLPQGSPWSVTLNGSPQGGAGQTIAFKVGNGSFNFTVSPPPGFEATPTNGSLSVHGSNRHLGVQFQAAGGVPPPAGDYVGLSGSEASVLLSVGLAITVVEALILVRWLRTNRRVGDSGD